LQPPPPPQAPQLSINASRPNIAISWTIPSTSYLLQQSPDLGSTNWTTVPAPPTLNFTNLKNEVTMPPFGSMKFFRLEHQRAAERNYHN
jgi:hypothetical protein